MSNLATYNAKIEPLLKMLAVAAASEGIPFVAVFEVPSNNGKVVLCCAKNGEPKSEPVALILEVLEAVTRQKSAEALERLMATFDPSKPLVPEPRPVSDETTDERAAFELELHERRGGSTH